MMTSPSPVLIIKRLSIYRVAKILATTPEAISKCRVRLGLHIDDPETLSWADYDRIRSAIVERGQDDSDIDFVKAAEKLQLHEATLLQGLLESGSAPCIVDGRLVVTRKDYELLSFLIPPDWGTYSTMDFDLRGIYACWILTRHTELDFIP